MFKYIKHAAVVASLVAAIGSAEAQTQPTVEMLLGQPGMAQQLQNLNTNTPSDLAPGEGVPSAANAKTANAQDINKSQDLLVQSTGKGATARSVVQRYYQILTGTVLEVYGSKEFSQQQDTQLLFFNTVGKAYRLAPGDVVRVTMRGLSQASQNHKIGRDGNLILNDLPPIPVSGLTIEEVEQNLLDILQLDDASASVFVSLETARLITVQVSGAVNEPRTLAVPAYTPLSRVLAYAGGVRPNGSLRNIILRDRDVTAEEVDFYDFLRSPLGANDPLVTDASRVFVPDQGATVAAFGFVARPAIYELPTGAQEISVKDLLSMSGTRILPPGLVLEAKYFDETGVSKMRSVGVDDQLKAGEVLNLRFVETRLQDAVTVVGAVLDEYSFATQDPVPVREVLKNGATLTRDVRIDFAMIVNKDGSARAINLERALQNDAETIAVGATLVLFDQQNYRRLVNADPNRTDDPLVAAISRADIAELYLNGQRLALIPPTQVTGFAATIQPYYRLTPETNLDLAIIETKDGAARAVSLRELMQGSVPFALNAGSKIHLFETTFLNGFVTKIDNRQNGDTVVLSEMGRASTLARLLSRSNILRVKLDGELLSVLPASASQKISTIFDVLGIEQSLSDLADFVELEQYTSLTQPQFKSLSLSAEFGSILPQASAIGFWSRKVLLQHIRADADDLKRLSSIGVTVFVDYKMEGVFSPSALSTATPAVDEVLVDARLYPLFAITRSFDFEEFRWDSDVLTATEILSRTRKDFGAGTQLYLFTREFVGTVLNQGASKQSQQLELALESQARPDEDITPEVIDGRIGAAAAGAATTLVGQTTLRNDSALMTSFIRFIGGAVQNPGQYPVAGAVVLSQLIDAAGGTLEGAELAKVSIQYLKLDGSSLIKGPTQIVNITNPKQADKIVLTGRYYVDIPFLINETVTGTVSLAGEVMRPGGYVIGRSETLHELIARAGGLSPVAYPLGAVFSRDSLKSQEREYNNLLAGQLEEAVLQLSSSDNANAGEQITAVLGYAKQLRTQMPAGRLTVNVALNQPDTPVYLEPGDTLYVPKRPSHVSVLGAVNRDTVAIYAPDKPLSAYLASAGGLTKLADIKKAYLLLPNGESVPATSSTIIPPGSAIVVPPKTDRLSVLGLTDLVSRVLGNIATSMLAINNVR